MVSISTGAFTTWELPWSMQTGASQVKTHAENFASHIEQADSHWAGLPASYSGPLQETFFSALSPAKVSAEFIRNAGILTEKALSEFATELQSLREQRSALIAEIESFNGTHAGAAEEELNGVEFTQYLSLKEAVGQLQTSYENLVTECANLLGHIKSGEVYGSTFNSTEGYTGSPIGISDFAEVPGWFDVKTTDSWQGVETQTYDPRTTQITADSAAANSTPTANSTNMSLFNTPIGSISSTVGGSSVLGTVGSALRNDRSPGSNSLQRLRNGFKGRFIDSLPGFADYKAWSERPSPTNTLTAGEPRHSTGSDGTMRSERTVSGTQTSNAFGNNLNRVATSGGSLVTLAVAANQYSNEKDMRQQKLAQENPQMTDEEINSEATHGAAAHTVGSAGSSILASALVGAGVGSAVPVAGTAIGFGAGLVTGVVMELPLLPDITGDGTRDSVADAMGHYAEKGWDLLRNDGVDTIKNAGNIIADGVSDLAESVSESNLNPLNWWD